MVQVQSIDTSGLQFVLGGLRNALIGTGGDISTITRDESKLLALGISKVAAPRDRKKTAERIDKSVRSKFMALSEKSDFEDNTGKEGHTGVKWYRCDKDFLFGVARDSDMRHADPQTVANIYYKAKKIQGKTRLLLNFKHPRKHQRVAIITKIITSKSVLKKAIAIVQKGIGKLPASWFATAKQLDTSLVAPEWMERHIKGNKTTKSITDATGLANLEHPSITFGSKAVGVTKFDRAIQFAVNLREKKVAARLRLVLSGYSKDVAQGIKVRRHAKQTI